MRSSLPINLVNRPPANMQDEPSPQLLDLLARLELATPRQVHALRGRAKRLARGTALVDWVWVDALVQLRRLTPLQGAEINAGRGEQLVVGPYLIQRLAAKCGYADSFIAVERQTKAIVQLVLSRHARAVGEVEVQRLSSSLATLVAQSATLQSDGTAKVLAAGCDERTVWAAYVPHRGICVSQWLACQGRFSPAAAWEIARQTAASLAALEAAGIVHGDVSAAALRIDVDGAVQLNGAGFRSIVRPDETANAEQLPIEAFDYLAPERVAERTLASAATDVYAFGCLCWHLLTGRTPLTGGNVTAKLAAVRSARFPNLRRLAPDANAEFVALLGRCVSAEASLRPQSFAEIAAALGSPTAAGRRRIVDAIARSQRCTVRPNWQWQVRTKLQRSATQLTAAAACIVLLTTATWPLWRSRHSPHHPLAAVQPAAVQPAAVQSAAVEPAASLAVASQPVQPVSVDSSAANGPCMVPLGDAGRQLASAGVESGAVRNATVQLANYQAKEQPRPVLELPSGADVAGATLRLAPGATVRGSQSQRVRILAPPSGVIVAAEDVRFENVDFVWRNPPQRIVAPDQIAIVDQRARHTEFVGCTFQATAAGTFGLPPAIRMRTAGARSSTLAPACQVRLERCTIGDVATAVEGASAGPMAIEIHDTLYVASGPLIRLNEPPAIDAPIAIELKHLTARGASSVLEIAGGRSSSLPGAISIEAVACALALQPTGALLTFTGPQLPKTASNGRVPIDWIGQGSLSQIDTVVANWHHDGTSETLPDDLIAVEGLVTGKLEFAATAGADPATSRLLYWLAPLFSDDPPGIGESLPKLPEF